jgi:membrane-associated phospholipid phosphatase
MSEQAVIDHPRRLSERGDDYSGSPLRALAVAGVLVLALGAVWALASLVPAIHFKDALALYEFTTLDTARSEPPLKFLLHLLDPSLFILWGIALVAVALAGERPRTALAVAAVLTLAPFSAELLKPLMAHSHDSYAYVSINPASWPSGHATAATALALCAVLVAPRRWRPYVAILAAAYVLAASVALLVLAWHMPSDVVGGILLASLWMALAIAALRASERWFPPRAAA